MTVDPGFIEYLVERKFTKTRLSYEAWQQSTIRRMFPSYEPLLKEAAEYRSQLESMSPAELQKILEEGLEEQADELQAKEELEDSTRFFNAPEANANFDHWTRVDFWTLDEATALSLGKAPEIVNHGLLVNRGLENRSPFTRAYMNRRNLLMRAKEARTLEFPVAPAAYVNWAEQRGIMLPKGLTNAVIAVGHRIEEWENIFAERDRLLEQVRLYKNEAAKGKPLAAKERNSLLRMVLGMAKAKYSYDPIKRNSAATQIVKDLERFELGLDADTVHKWLTKADEEVSV